MGYEVYFNDGTPESDNYVFAFGSATDLDGIGKWVHTLKPVENFPRLLELFVTSLSTKNTMELGAELEVARDAFPPPDCLLPILETFAEHVGVGDEDETVTIGDGSKFPQSKADAAAVRSALNGEDTGDDAEGEG